MLFISTGVQIHLAQAFFADMGAVRTLHIALGVFIILWDLVLQPILLFGEKHFLDMIPTHKDVRDLILILLCATGLIGDKHYPHYDFYDKETGHYVRKFHPAQKFLAVTDILAMVGMAYTGIALAEMQEAGSTGVMQFLTFFNGIFNLIPFVEVTMANLRFVHFLLFVFFTFTTLNHIYFAFIPNNYSRLRGMVMGTEEIEDKEVNHGKAGDEENLRKTAVLSVLIIGVIFTLFLIPTLFMFDVVSELLFILIGYTALAAFFPLAILLVLYPLSRMVKRIQARKS